MWLALCSHCSKNQSRHTVQSPLPEPDQTSLCTSSVIVSATALLSYQAEAPSPNPSLIFESSFPFSQTQDPFRLPAFIFLFSSISSLSFRFLSCGGKILQSWRCFIGGQSAVSGRWWAAPSVAQRSEVRAAANPVYAPWLGGFKIRELGSDVHLGSGMQGQRLFELPSLWVRSIFNKTPPLCPRSPSSSPPPQLSPLWRTVSVIYSSPAQSVNMSLHTLDIGTY